MNGLIGGCVLILTLGFSSVAVAQDRGEKRFSKSAIVIELEAPQFSDIEKRRVAGDMTFYQTGNKRTALQRSADATKFCNGIRYKSGLVLQYETVQTGASDYDYLKRIICFD